jgi:hypothetical protein
MFLVAGYVKNVFQTMTRKQTLCAKFVFQNILLSPIPPPPQKKTRLKHCSPFTASLIWFVWLRIAQIVSAHLKANLYSNNAFLSSYIDINIAFWPLTCNFIYLGRLCNRCKVVSSRCVPIKRYPHPVCERQKEWVSVWVRAPLSRLQETVGSLYLLCESVPWK